MTVAGAPLGDGDSWDGNDAGRATAMTLLTPLQWWAVPWLRLVLWAFRHVVAVKALRELSFIHFAHWSVLDGLAPTAPAADTTGSPEAGGGRRRPYLLFESNFNGTWHEYINAFCQVVGGGIQAILMGSEGFPGLSPVRGFTTFMEHHEVVADHYYAAYPDATATMVRAAFELRPEVDGLRRAAAGGDAARFAAAWATASADAQVQVNLAGQACRLPGVAAYLRQVLTGRKNVAGGTYSFVALTPVRAGDVAELRSRLHGLSRDESPFGGVPGTHFARWVIIDRLFHDSWPEQYQPVEPAYLLFTAVFDISGPAPATYLDTLLEALPEADAVWSCCDGWPSDDRAAQRAYLSRHQRDVHFLFAAYQGTVGEVRQAHADRLRLVEFAADAQEAQGADPAAILAAFQSRFGEAHPLPPAHDHPPAQARPGARS